MLQNVPQLFRMQNQLAQLEMQIHLPVIGATLLTFGLQKLNFVFQNWQGNSNILSITNYYYDI